MPRLLITPKAGFPSTLSGWQLSDDDPTEFAKVLGGYSDRRAAAEELYARALALGITEPDDPRIYTEIFDPDGCFGLYFRMAESAIKVRLALANPGHTKCHLQEAGLAED